MERTVVRWKVGVWAVFLTAESRRGRSVQPVDAGQRSRAFEWGQDAAAIRESG